MYQKSILVDNFIIDGGDLNYDENINKRLLQEANSWKIEKGCLKDLIKSLKSELNEKTSSLSVLQASLADVLIAKTGEETSTKAKQIHKLAIELKERLVFCENQLKELRKERDKYISNTTVLEGKMSTCTQIATEQADFIQNQLETICKLEAKIEDFQNNLQRIDTINKDEQTRLQEQVELHQQRANIQDKKIRKLQHELEHFKLQNYKFETKECILEEQLETQTKICQETTKELRASTKEIEKLSNMCANLQEQQEKIDQIWFDNARLTQILASAGQYKDLANEMHDGKGLVYMPPTSRGAKILSLSHRYECCKSQTQRVNSKSELDQWVPAEAYDILMAFRKQCCPNISILIFQELMGDISICWRNRAKRQMALLKKKYAKRIMDLKRQLLQRIPYRHVVPEIPIKSLSKNPKKYELNIMTPNDNTPDSNTSLNYEFQPLQVFYSAFPRGPKIATSMYNTFAFGIPTPPQQHKSTDFGERQLSWTFNA